MTVGGTAISCTTRGISPGADDMLIVGALSSILDYVFDVALEGGRQARRLRARSFFVQLASECAVLRIHRAACWNIDAIVMRAAGRFVLAGPRMKKEDEYHRVRWGAGGRRSSSFRARHGRARGPRYSYLGSPSA